jgi:hypothetical protein
MRFQSSIRVAIPVNSGRSARIFTAPCACRRRPSGSREPVGRSPAAYIPAIDPVCRRERPPPRSPPRYELLTRRGRIRFHTNGR